MGMVWHGMAIAGLVLVGLVLVGLSVCLLVHLGYSPFEPRLVESSRFQSLVHT
jgi:Na+/H+-translocating membrane pyrophosphatase